MGDFRICEARASARSFQFTSSSLTLFCCCLLSQKGVGTRRGEMTAKIVHSERPPTEDSVIDLPPTPPAESTSILCHSSDHVLFPRPSWKDQSLKTHPRRINGRFSRENEDIVQKPTEERSKEWCNHGDLQETLHQYHAGSNTTLKDVPKSRNLPLSKHQCHSQRGLSAIVVRDREPDSSHSPFPNRKQDRGRRREPISRAASACRRRVSCLQAK